MDPADRSGAGRFAPTGPAVRIAVINVGVSDASSTRVLPGLIAQQAIDRLAESGLQTTVSFIDLGLIAVEIAQSIVSDVRHRSVEIAIE